jgi:tRNA pseudouridine55 synthase
MIHRVLRLDKVRGPTSHDVVDRVRRLLHQRQVGHAGTLDPLATGLLLVCAGRATKIAPLLSDLDKVYHARVRLGVATDTDDAEGVVTTTTPIPADIAGTIAGVLPRFLGETLQVPPMASAIKVRGEPLHRLRRAGITVERSPRAVVVHAIDVLAVAPPFVDLRITCGKGTYIRTLAADLATAAGTCGHLAALRRERIGPFTLDGAVASDALAGADPEQVLAQAGMSLAEALGHLPAVVLDDDAAYAVRHGVVPRWRDIRAVGGPLKSGDQARLEGPDGELVAVVVASEPLDEEKLGHTGGGAAASPAAGPAPLRFRRVLVGRTGS